MFFKHALIAATILVAAPLSLAQVEVVDRKIPSDKRASPDLRVTSPASQQANTPNSEMYYQLQVLQQEVLQLRGLVEEQGHELKKLKQQRLDDYLDLDRRIGQLGKAGSNSVVSPSVPSVTSSATSTLPPASATDEMQQYKDAMNLVFKDQKYDEALVALTQYLNDFPAGRYAANAQYWLGEVCLKKELYDQAKNWFSRVIGEFPDNPKVPDAQYKLGIVYHKLGDQVNAKKFLQIASQSDSNAARLAQEYLTNNF